MALDRNGGLVSPVIATLALAIALSVVAPPVRADGFPVSQVIEAIKPEINLARLASSPEDRQLEIISVVITLTAVAHTEGEAGIKLEVPVVERLAGIDAYVSAELANTQKVVLTLSPLDEPKPISGVASLGLAPAIALKGSIRLSRRSSARSSRPTFRAATVLFRTMAQNLSPVSYTRPTLSTSFPDRQTAGGERRS